MKEKILDILYPPIPEIPTTQDPEDTRYTFRELGDYIIHFRFLKDRGFWIIVGIFTLVYFFC